MRTKETPSATTTALAVIFTLGFSTILNAEEQALPLKDGAYITEPKLCEKYFKNDLDFIDFEVTQSGRSFDFFETGCLVYSVKQMRKNRYKVEADCIEGGEGYQRNLFIDVFPNQSIRIDGGELHHFCKRVEKSVPIPTRSIPKLIKAWEVAYEGCRGGFGDDAKTDKACENSESLSQKLNELGYCVSNSGWKRC